MKHKKSTTGQSYVYMIGPPHVTFAVDTWIARKGVVFAKGKMEVGACRPKKGVMLIAPPGHGKSDYASHYLALEINLNPSTQSMYVHAIADKAQDQKAYIAALFTTEHSAGRRNQSLFGLTLDKVDNNKTKMRIKLSKKTKSPTITACGMSAATLGADTTFQIFDDIVPQSDVDQPTERERRFRLLSGTFSTRQRGSDTFKIFIGTFWHYADALSQTWKSALKNDTLVLSKQTTGGPRAGKKGVFEPLWPEVYPASELSRRFDEMRRDYAIWSANYMGDPVSDEMRLIRKLKLYDPQDESHTQFLSSAIFHLSCDPAATSQESSDKAGILYAGVGEVPVVVRDKTGMETVAYHRRLRILDYKQIHASQTDLADTVANYVNSRPVFQVHVETRGGYHATADIMENKYGVECIRHDPKSQSKEIRLKQCAGVMDAGLDGMDPVVEFPGMRGANGDVVPSDEHRHLYQQFLDFGFAEEDHLLDCTTQLVNYLLKSGDLVAGSAAATISTRKFSVQGGDPRVRAVLDYWAKPRPEPNDSQSDWDFINNEGNANGYGNN